MLAAAIDALLPGRHADRRRRPGDRRRRAARALPARAAGSPTGSGSVETLAEAEPADAGHRRRAGHRHRRRGPRRARRPGQVPRPTGGVLSVAAPRVPGRGAPATSWTGRARCSASAPTWCCATRRRSGCTGCASRPADAALADRLAPAYRAVERAADPRHAHRLQRRRRRRHLPRRGRAGPARPARSRSCGWCPALAAAPVAAFFRDPRAGRARTTRPRSWPPATARCSRSSGCTTSASATSEFLRIAVFLSVLDVHVNRSPVAGRVVDYFVVDGGYAAAMKPEAEHNVAAYTVLETDPRHGRRGPADRADRPPDRAAGAGRLAAGQGRAVRPDPVRLAHRRLPAGRRGRRRWSPPATG